MVALEERRQACALVEERGSCFSCNSTRAASASPSESAFESESLIVEVLWEPGVLVEMGNVLAGSATAARRRGELSGAAKPNALKNIKHD